MPDPLTPAQAVQVARRHLAQPGGPLGRDIAAGLLTEIDRLTADRDRLTRRLELMTIRVNAADYRADLHARRTHDGHPSREDRVAADALDVVSLRGVKTPSMARDGTDWGGLAAQLTGHPAVATAKVTCTGAPVQLEGTLTDGRHWYFRSRFSHATLGAAATFDEAVDTHQAEVYIGPDYEASWLDPGRTREVFLKLLAELLPEEGTRS